MKGIILTIFAISTLSILVFASAIPEYPNEDRTPHEVSIRVYEGWNLIAGIPELNVIPSTSDIQKDNIIAIYAYLPKSNEYLRAFPDPEQPSYSVDEDQIMSSAFWLYSDKEGIFRYTSESILKLESRQLYSRWNFVAITNEFSDYSLNQLKGSCNLEKVFAFDIGTNQWDTISETDYGRNLFEDYTILEPGRGMLIKVSQNCKMSLPVETIDGPPQIPTGSLPIGCGETDNVIDYDTAGVTTGPKEGSSQTTWKDNCATSNILVEYYCTEDGVESESYDCPNGCSNGACI